MTTWLRSPESRKSRFWWSHEHTEDLSPIRIAFAAIKRGPAPAPSVNNYRFNEHGTYHACLHSWHHGSVEEAQLCQPRTGIGRLVESRHSPWNSSLKT